MCNAVDSFYAIIDIHEAASLLAIAPDVDLQILAIDSVDQFAADCRRSFLPSAIPGAIWAVDVVKSRNKRLHASFMPVFFAKHLRNELFPAVTPLRHGRI